MDPKPRKLDQSRAWLRRAEGLIPAYTQTLSKGPTQFVQGVAPIYLERGKGAHVWDVDGNDYIDLPGALGPIILGYDHPSTNAAIEAQLRKGITFSLMHPIEVEVAELLRDVVPCAQMVRFAKNGSDVTTAAVRVARAHTGREKIAKCGYHGAQDWHVASLPRDRGVPRFNKELLKEFKYNDIASLERVFAENPGEIAGVILEPLVYEEPRDRFLHKVKELTHANGAVLIFDEVKTGFRVALGGAMERFGVTPDLAAVGKAIANGMPLSALVGRADVMRECETVFFSMTFGGECLSLAAAKATIEEMRRARVHQHLGRMGAQLQGGTNKILEQHGLSSHIRCIGLPEKSGFEFLDSPAADALTLKSLFQQEVLKRGVLWNGEHMLTLSHGETEIEQVLTAYEDAARVVADAMRRGAVETTIEGKKLEPVFRAR